MQKKNEIAVRLYVNEKFGKACAKGLRHTAIFNAAADLFEPRSKYLLDLHTFDKWQHTAKTDEQMELLAIVSEQADKDTLASWVVRYDNASKSKTYVTGYCTLDINTNQLDLFIVDEYFGVKSRWQLTAKPCKEVSGKRAPSLLATNAEDLGQW